MSCEIIHAGVQALMPNSIRSEPLIFRHRGEQSSVPANNTTTNNEPTVTSSANIINSVASTDINQTNTEIPQATRGDRGNILLRSFWESGTDCIVDVRMTDCNAPSQHQASSERILENHEKKKKKQKYLRACLDQRMYFTPLVFRTDGMMGREAKAFNKSLARHLTLRWRRSYSRVLSYMKVHLSIACVLATHRTLRGSRTPVQDVGYLVPSFEDGSVISLLIQ